MNEPHYNVSHPVWPYILLAIIIAVLVVGIIWAKKGDDNLPPIGGVPGQDGDTPNEGDFKTFTSPSLGASFDYNPDQDGNGAADVNVKQIDNKIYISAFNQDLNQGQWVQVFSKNPTDSFELAIRKQILQNISSKDCFVVIDKERNPSHSASNYVTAQILYPHATEGLDTNFEFFKKCPQDYAATNGIRYFLYDNNFPDRFAFFSIGQDSISVTPMMPWQNTFKFTSRTSSQLCGGIAGVRCPSGFTCQLDGRYPVASGTCVNQPDQKTVSSFQSCIAAGYPIMESYPEKCRTPDGLTFVRYESCIQVIASARNPQTGEVRDFPTPCDIPQGWQRVD